MITNTLFILLASLFTPTAFAEGADEEYLLGDIGVRIDLPRSVSMTRWSDWDFKAETNDRKVMVFAWAAGVQSPMRGTAAEDWSGEFIKKATTIGGSNAKQKDASFVDVDGATTANISISFEFDGSPMFLHGSAHEVAGSTFYISTIAKNKRNSRRASRLRDTLRDTLDLRNPPTDVSVGNTLSAAGVETTLPDGWRAPLDSEMAIVNKELSTIGVALEDHCFAAIHPHAGDISPDLAITCQGGMWLGIVDELSFSDKEALLRKKVFGNAPVQPATPVSLDDRIGFTYQHALADRSLSVGIVPYSEGLARTWIIGSLASQTSNAIALNAMLTNSSFAGPHPISLGDRAEYLMYRPVLFIGVLGGFLLLLGGGLLGAKRVLGGGTPNYEDY
jgi:hypothetical protein